MRKTEKRNRLTLLGLSELSARNYRENKVTQSRPRSVRVESSTCCLFRHFVEFNSITGILMQKDAHLALLLAGSSVSEIFRFAHLSFINSLTPEDVCSYPTDWRLLWGSEFP
ncbi:hypothetical protein EVAR_47885_1 [Eumeta japonica]|uniref:Uncharacterized protein n=1 Tax=Eumeta variegata TaxID=151549 RepID=A0A4C1YBC6_EUMVA|nr:hypothetical protein EVAR_47885_1 [Eumeta japonica]